MKSFPSHFISFCSLVFNFILRPASNKDVSFNHLLLLWLFNSKPRFFFLSFVSLVTNSNQGKHNHCPDLRCSSKILPGIRMKLADQIVLLTVYISQGSEHSRTKTGKIISCLIGIFYPSLKCSLYLCIQLSWRGGEEKKFFFLRLILGPCVHKIRQQWAIYPAPFCIL